MMKSFANVVRLRQIRKRKHNYFSCYFHIKKDPENMSFGVSISYAFFVKGDD